MGGESTSADPTSSHPSGPRHTDYLTYERNARPPWAPPPPSPIVALLIVQYEEISHYHGYSDRGMHTILIKSNVAKRTKQEPFQGQSPSEAFQLLDT